MRSVARLQIGFTAERFPWLVRNSACGFGECSSIYSVLPVLKRLGVGTILLAVVLATVLAPEALAQGCSMCVKNAAAAGEAGRKALNTGILILLTPTLLLFGGVFFLLHRRNNSHHTGL